MQLNSLTNKFESAQKDLIKGNKKLIKSQQKTNELSSKLEELSRNAEAQGDFLDAQVKSIKDEILEFRNKIELEIKRNSELLTDQMNAIAQPTELTVPLYADTRSRLIAQSSNPESMKVSRTVDNAFPRLTELMSNDAKSVQSKAATAKLKRSGFDV